MDTLVILKPDCLIRNLEIEILSIIKAHFLVKTEKKIVPSRELIEKHYEEHKEKPFFNELVNFMTGKEVVVLRCDLADDTKNTVSFMRLIVGPTDGSNPLSLRGMFKDKNAPMMHNLIHSSDSPESAIKELSLWNV